MARYHDGKQPRIRCPKAVRPETGVIGRRKTAEHKAIPGQHSRVLCAQRAQIVDLPLQIAYQRVIPKLMQQLRNIGRLSVFAEAD